MPITDHGLFGSRKPTQTFLTGVIAILPLALTSAVLIYLVILLHDLTGPGSMCGRALRSLGMSIVACEVTAYIIGMIGVLLLIYFLGVLIESGAALRWQNTMGNALDRVPVLGTVYSASKQVTSVFDQNPESKQGMAPVICYFGNDRSAATPALMPTAELVRIGEIEYRVVLIPTAPVPFGGALILVKASLVEPAECGFDDLVGVYMSMGLTAPQSLQRGGPPQDGSPVAPSNLA